MIEKIMALISVFLITVGGVSGLENVFCESFPMQDADWTENITLPKFDPGMGILKSVDISVDFNISQNFMIENTGNMNSSINSSIKSRLMVEIPDVEAITANANTTLVEELDSFDGIRDFAGLSGINLTKSASSGTVRYSSNNIQDYVASFPGEMLQLKGVVQSTPNIVISGAAYSAIRTTAGAKVCIYYYYD
jgi:hypothetical protein